MSAAAQWMQTQALARSQPLCLEMSADFRVRAVHGDPAHYGLELAPAAWACPALPLLYGLDPAEALRLDSVNFDNGVTADLWLEPDGDGCRLLLLDVSQRHAEVQEMQQQRHDLELMRLQLRKALTEAEQANAAKSRFIASMSHEFRTPLTSIQGYAERLLLQQPESREAAAVRNAARYLVTLVDNLLEQGRINASEILIQPAPCRLKDLVGELTDMFEPLAERRGLALRVEVGEELPEWVEVDDTRLRQIAVNLLGNACKFTAEGHVGLKLSWAGGQLTLAVDDSGPGIAPENVDRVFTPFERVNEDQPGVGLGLAISRQLAQRMGGDLTLRSTVGTGSCFTLAVLAPRCPDPDSEIPDTPLDILLAEDDDALALLFETVLDEAGHRVQRATNVPEALEMSQHVLPRCVLTDLNLKGGSGLELIQRLRQAGFDGRIVTLTGSTAAADRERALLAGADYFLCKPVDFARLKRVVHAD